MSDRADPPPVARFDAEELGRRFAARRRWIGLALILSGIALLVGGFTGFGVYSDRADALQKDGIHTTATVTDTARYGGPRGPNRFTEHIDVAFTTPSGTVHGVRIPIGEQDRFSVGQRVEISYDPAHPQHAVFAHGYVDPGPIGFVFFFGIVAGVLILVYGFKALRLAGGARRALESTGRAMTVESRPAARGRRGGTALVLDNGGGGEPRALWATAGSDWSLPQTVEATVFGTGEGGSVVVVVDPRRGAVTAGRIWKRRRI